MSGSAYRIASAPLSGNVSISFNLKYPSPAPTSTSSVSIATLGYGAITIVTNGMTLYLIPLFLMFLSSVNHPPVASVCSAQTREDIAVNIAVNGEDPDGDIVLVVVDQLPVSGKLYLSQTNMTLLQLGVGYPLPNGLPYPNFYYVPSLHYSGSDSFLYHLSDGCVSTSSLLCSLAVQYYNYPPTANAQAVTIPENALTAITLTGNYPWLSQIFC